MFEVLLPKIISVPFDDGAFWRKGAKEGPEAILREFKKLRPYSMQSARKLDMEPQYASVPIKAYSAADTLKSIEKSVTDVLSEGFAPYVLGGDHSITLPIVRALANRYGKKSFKILHFDAHSDTFDGVDGYEYHHGAVFRNIVEEGLVSPADIHQFGVRGFVRGDGLTYADKMGISYVPMENFRQASLNISRFCRQDDTPVYVSIDIDAIDPAFAPGTGTPVPGGFSSSEFFSIIKQLQSYPVIGIDLVEVAPAYDVGNLTALLAAHILLENLISINFVKGAVT